MDDVLLCVNAHRYATCAGRRKGACYINHAPIFLLFCAQSNEPRARSGTVFLNPQLAIGNRQWVGGHGPPYVAPSAGAAAATVEELCLSRFLA